MKSEEERGKPEGGARVLRIKTSLSWSSQMSSKDPTGDVFASWVHQPISFFSSEHSHLKTCNEFFKFFYHLYVAFKNLYLYL